MYNISQLIQAAEYLDRREREAEHGYASTAPMPEYLSKKKSRPKKSQGNRSTHNELEKNRRAHLRYCLEKLKDVVPLGPDSSRHTTLGLLTKTKSYIRNLEETERRKSKQREELKRQQKMLQRRLEGLMEGQYRLRQERSISECSTSTNSTSSTSESDDHEIDIIGDGSSTSDTDDQSSVDSLNDSYFLPSKPVSSSLTML